MAERGFDQARLARETKASTGTVANWCTGKRGVGPEYAEMLKELLGLDPRIWWRRKPARRPAPQPARRRARTAAARAA